MKKIQTKEMEKDIERSKDISRVWLYGGKAIGGIIHPNKKKNGVLLTINTKQECKF